MKLEPLDTSALPEAEEQFTKTYQTLKLCTGHRELTYLGIQQAIIKARMAGINNPMIESIMREVDLHLGNTKIVPYKNK